MSRTPTSCQQSRSAPEETPSGHGLDRFTLPQFVAGEAPRLGRRQLAAILELGEELFLAALEASAKLIHVEAGGLGLA